jgi:hypothetical protein
LFCRDGWKGRAIVALGCKQGTPLSMHPLLCAVSRPVRHARLAAALLRWAPCAQAFLCLFIGT